MLSQTFYPKDFTDCCAIKQPLPASSQDLDPNDQNIVYNYDGSSRTSSIKFNNHSLSIIKSLRIYCRS